jgi:hypothetical protein
MRLGARWAGLVLIALGVVGIVALSLLPPGERGPLGGWILSSTLSYERVLPLLGLGVVLALVSPGQRLAAFALFSLGIALGFFFAHPFVSAVEVIPGAITHHFLTGPISSTAAGLSLAVPGQTRRWVLPVAAMVAGAMLGVAIRLTDPSFHDPTFVRAGIAVAFGILAAVCLTAWAFRQSWFETAGRIFGSWLIAIGLLYGGASLIPPRSLVPPRQLESPAISPNELTGPGANRNFPEIDQSNRQPLPGGFDPRAQP